MKLRYFLITMILFICGLVFAEAPWQEQVREYRQKNEHKILSGYLQLLSIPNVASDTEYIRKNADYLMKLLKDRGIPAQLLESADPKAPPEVYGEWVVPGAKRTILIYAHYDGQPTNPDDWMGSHPWKPVIRSAALEAGGKIIPLPEEDIDPEWRIYARSASDDKAGVWTILNAIDALKASGLNPTSNIKILFEGEEEAGSPHLGEILRKHQDILRCDVWIIIDGPVHQSGKKMVVFGVRGDTNVDVTLYGAIRPLHSGHYGNWSPNPALRLAKLLAGMKDDQGHVLIEGWYDDVQALSEREKKAIHDAPDYDSELLKQLGVHTPDGGGQSLLELINLPSLNINGIRSADAGKGARNIVPATATSTLDLRVVKNVDYRKQVDRLKHYIESQGYYVIPREPTIEERLQYPLIATVVHEEGGYNAQRTSMDSPISLAVLKAVQSTVTDPIVALPTSGGSLPLSILEEILQTPAISVPIANYDNNQHAENENIRIQNLWDGMETVGAVMLMEP